MALKLLNDADLPAAVRGISAATEPKITISSVGQFRFNKLAADIFDGCTHIQVAYDDDKRILGFVGTKDPKKGPVTYPITKDKKGALYLSGSRVCRLIKWDYKYSGNWVSDVSADAAKKRILVVLPDPQPAAPPIAPRKRKAAPANPPATPSVEVAGADINLDDE